MPRIASAKDVRVWTPVAVIHPDHPRFRQAGTVQAHVEGRDDAIGVRFDTGEQAIETVLISHLETL